MLDASSLRRQIGLQALAINRLVGSGGIGFRGRIHTPIKLFIGPGKWRDCLDAELSAMKLAC